LDGDAFDPFYFVQDFCATSEVDVGWREIVQALVIAVIIVIDRDGDLRLLVPGQIIVFEQDAVLSV
jgi:hypothetical protein